MTMGHCKVCKHWERKPWIDYSFKGWGYCGMMKIDGDEPMHSGTLAVVEGDNYHIMQVMTAPDFGCVQFQTRDNE